MLQVCAGYEGCAGYGVYEVHAGYELCGGNAIGVTRPVVRFASARVRSPAFAESALVFAPADYQTQCTIDDCCLFRNRSGIYRLDGVLERVGSGCRDRGV